MSKIWYHKKTDPLLSRWRASYNPYFFVPFLLWVCIGAVVQLLYSRQQLFFAINTHYSDFANVFMFYFTWLGQAEVIIPALLLLPVIPRFRNWKYLALAALCNFIPFLIHHYLKSWLNHPRPRLLYRDIPEMHFLPSWPELLHSGFPSGHSQGAFSFFCFLSLLLPRKYRGYGLLFFVMAITVGYSRIYLAAHLFEDVYAGSIFGVVTTSVIYFATITYQNRKQNSTLT